MSRPWDYGPGQLSPSPVSQESQKLSQPDVTARDAPKCRQLINPVSPEHPADGMKDRRAGTCGAETMALTNRSVGCGYGVSEHNGTTCGGADEQADEKQRREQYDEEDERDDSFKHRYPGCSGRVHARIRANVRAHRPPQGPGTGSESRGRCSGRLNEAAARRSGLDADFFSGPRGSDFMEAGFGQADRESRALLSPVSMVRQVVMIPSTAHRFGGTNEILMTRGLRMAICK